MGRFSPTKSLFYTPPGYFSFLFQYQCSEKNSQERNNKINRPKQDINPPLKVKETRELSFDRDQKINQFKFQSLKISNT